jgi:NADH-quinone oxidoreductase subunit H
LLQWVKGTFPRLRIDQMLDFAWKVLVPSTLGLILWEMVALKLPGGTTVQYGALLLGNLVVIAIVIRVLSGYFKHEQIRTKRTFEPTTLIGTMQQAPSVGD